MKNNKITAAAESMPGGLMYTRGICMATVHGSRGNWEEYHKACCNNIAQLLSELENQVYKLSRYYGDRGQYADAVRCCEFVRGLLPIIYGEERYVPPFHNGLENMFVYPAANLVKLGRYNEAIALLEAGLTYEGEQAKGYNVKETVDTPLLRGCTFRFWGHEYTREMKTTLSEFRQELAPLEGDLRYESFLAKLSAMAE